MKKTEPLLKNITSILLNSSKEANYKVIVTIIIIVISAIVEVLFLFGIGIFLNKIFNDKNYFEYDITIRSMALFMVLIIIANMLFRYLSLKFQSEASQIIGEEISTKVYKNAISINYQSYIEFKSSDFVNRVALKCDQIISNVVTPYFNLLSVLITSVLMTISLLLYSSKTTIVVFSSLYSMYFTINILTKKKIYAYGKNISIYTSRLIKLIQESFGSYRDIIIDGSKELWISRFIVIDEEIRKNKKNIHIVANLPRILIEGLLLTLIFTAIFVNEYNREYIKSIMPIFGIYIVALQRILPIMQGGFSSLATIKSSESVIYEILKSIEMREPIQEKSTDINFDRCIEFRDVEFKYKNSKHIILKNINLEIKKGESICIQGKTGSGKTTLLDILLGLLLPTSGNIYVDDVKLENSNYKSWMKNLAHVPQKIYLVDGSILENITLGAATDGVDTKRLELAVGAANLTQTINNLEMGLDSPVGENGIFLSGGQIQRIAIARAIYRKAKILVFDESTSALDSITEKDILNNIKKLGVTIIFITHSVELTTFFDKNFTVDNGMLALKN